MRFAAVVICLFALAAPAYAAAPSGTPDLAQAESLIRAGRAAEAFALLEPFEAQSAGSADFDYWLGVAALEAGRPDRASIALERALIQNPDFVGARLDLGRAYFALGDFDRARLEFRTVLEQNPPAGARETIERHLAEMDARTQARLKRWTAYVEASVGHDSNVNYATGSGSVFVPLFGLNLALAPASVKASDNYFGLGGGAEANLPLSDETTVFAGLDYRHRINFKQDLYDYNRFDGRVGLQYATTRNAYRASFNYGRYYLDNRYNYDASGLALEWRHALDNRNVLSVLGLRNRIHYPDPAFEGNNATQMIFGAGWAHAFNEKGTSFVFGSVYFGNEQDRNLRIDGSREMRGARVAGQWNFAPAWDAYASLTAQWSDYDRENFVFAATRKDRLYEAALGVVWRVGGNWTLRPQLAYTRNNSNIVIYDYDRYDVSLTLRYDFK